MGGKGSSARGGEEVVNYQYVPFDSLDPQRVSDGQVIVGQNLLEGLVTPDAAGTGVVPATADSWTLSRDRTAYVFHIRSGAKWSDGTPITAQDFEWSYRRLLRPSTSARDTALNGASGYRPDLGIKNATAGAGNRAVAGGRRQVPPRTRKPTVRVGSPPSQPAPTPRQIPNERPLCTSKR